MLKPNYRFSCKIFDTETGETVVRGSVGALIEDSETLTSILDETAMRTEVASLFHTFDSYRKVFEETHYPVEQNDEQ